MRRIKKQILKETYFFEADENGRRKSKETHSQLFVIGFCWRQFCFVMFFFAFSFDLCRVLNFFFVVVCVKNSFLTPSSRNDFRLFFFLVLLVQDFSFFCVCV